MARLERWATPPGAVFLRLRVALTGARRSPPLHPVIDALGRGGGGAPARPDA
jgi:hypothetical protein